MTDPRQQTFDEIRRARRTDPATSKEAARRAHGLAHEHRQRILSALADGTARTADEIAPLVGLDRHQVGRRLGEMRDDGYIVVADETRQTPRGRAAQCWKLPPSRGIFA